MTKEKLSETKKGWRWWLFNRFGPPEVRNLIDHIDSMTMDGEFDIAIYPLGKFPFQIRTSAENHQEEPYIFATPQERHAFSAGVGLGAELCGVTTQMLDPEQAEIVENMRKKATHGGGGSRNN